MTTYVDPFGGSAIQPADVSFRTLDLVDALTQLVWPLYSEDSVYFAAKSMKIVDAVAGAVLRLPDASQVGVGASILFMNSSAEAVTLQDSAGGAVSTLAVGQAFYIGLEDNSTAAGSWGVVQFGASVSNVDAAQLAGAGLRANMTQLDTNWPVNDTSTDYIIASTDRATALVWTGGAGTVTLPLTSTLTDGFVFAIRNEGTGTVTIEADPSELVDGALTVTLAPQESALVFAAVGDWYTVGRGRNQQFNFTLLTKNVTGGTVVLTPTEAANIVQLYVGALVSNCIVEFPNVVQVYYVSNQTTGAFSLTFRAAGGLGTSVTVPSGQNAVLFCDGTNVINNSTTVSGITSLVLNAGSVSTPSISYSGDSDTGIYRPAADVVGIVGAGVDVLRISGAVGGVNYTQISSATTSNPVSIAAVGTDANISISFVPKGTGAVLFPSGTGATPAISFLGDTNTGIYRAAADDIGFATSGVGRMRLSNSKLNLGPFIASPNLADAIPTDTYTAINRLNSGTVPALTPGTVLTLIGAAAAGSPSYLQLVSGNGAVSGVRFGDNDAALRGGVDFDHVNERIRVWSQGLEAMHLTPGSVSFGDIAAGNYFNFLPAVGGGLHRIDAYAAAGSVNMDLSPMPTDAVSNVRFGVFRSTNTSGSKTLSIFRGNGSATIDHVFTSGSSGLLADFCRNGGNAQFGGDVVIADVGPTSTLSAGFRGSPVVIRNATQSFVLTDAGKTMRKSNTTAYTWTIDPDATLDFPIGTIIRLQHDSTAGNITVARGAGVALVNGTTDADQSITAGNRAEIQKMAANRWRWIT